PASRMKFWDKRLSNLTFQSELPRWEFAFTVAHHHVIPTTLFDPSATGQVEEAKKFLKEVVVTPTTRLEKNLGYSMQAVNYALPAIKLEAPNWDKYRGDPSWERDPSRPKDPLDVCLYDEVRPEVRREITAQRATAILDQLRIRANLAKRKRCGNC